MSTSPTSVRPRRSWAVRVGLLLLAVILVHGVLWYVAAGQILSGIPNFVAEAAQAGWTIEGGSMHRAGWPWTATVRIPDVSATRPLGDASVRWTAGSVDVTLRPQDPGTLRVTAHGAQAVEVQPGFRIPFTAGRLLLRVRLDGDGPVLLDADALEPAHAGGPALRVATLSMRLDPLSVAADVTGAMPIPPLPAPFAGPLDLHLHAAVTRPFPPAATPDASATAWRAAGGRAELPEVVLHWGPLEASGSGTAQLDAQLQPEAQALLRVTGAPEVVDALARAGLLAAGPASAVRAVLGLLALGAPGRPVALPMTLQDSVLTVARFPLTRVPPLDWGR